MDVERQALGVAALQTADVGLGDPRVGVDAEQERHVDVAPLVDHLLDRRQALVGARDLDHQVGAVDQVPVQARLLHRALGVVGQARRDLERDEAVGAARLVVDAAQHVGGLLDVLDGDRPVDLARGLALLGELLDLLVVVGRAEDRLLEDRRVGGQPAQGQLVDEALRARRSRRGCGGSGPATGSCRRPTRAARRSLTLTVSVISSSQRGWGSILVLVAYHIKRCVSCRASSAAPSTPAWPRWRAIRISVCVPTPGRTYCTAVSRAGTSSRSPAADAPPPMQTTSRVERVDRAGDPDAQAAVRGSAAPRSPAPRRPGRPLVTSGPDAYPRSRPSRSSSRPAASDSSEPGCGKRSAAGGAPLGQVEPDDDVAQLGRGAGRPAEDAPVDHDAAADAGADREHHEVAGGEPELLVVGLGEGRYGRVVVDEHRQARALAEHLAEGDVGQRDVHRRPHAPGLPLHDRRERRCRRRPPPRRPRRSHR